MRVWIKGCCARILFKNTKMRFDNHGSIDGLKRATSSHCWLSVVDVGEVATVA